MIENVFTNAICETGMQAISRILRRTPVRVFIWMEKKRRAWLLNEVKKIWLF